MRQKLLALVLAGLPTLAQIAPVLAQQQTAAVSPDTPVNLPGLYYDPDPGPSPTFQQLTSAEEAGYVEVPPLPSGVQLPYQMDRAWPQGATPDQMIKFGDLQQNPVTVSFTKLTLREISAQQGTNIAGVPIGDVPLVYGLTIDEVDNLYTKFNNGEEITLDDAAPAIQAAVGILQDPSQAGKQIQQAALTTAEKVLIAKLSEIPALKGIPLQDLAKGNWQGVITNAEQIQLADIGKKIGPTLKKLPVNQIVPIIEGVVQGDWEQVRKRAQAVLVQRGTEITLKELYKEVPELKNLPLGAVPDLVNQPIEQALPKIVDLAIEEIPGAEDELINSVPGLSEIPMNKLPFDLAFSFLAGDVFARFDIAYSGVEGKEEPSIQHSLSGGSEDQKFRPIKCTLGQTKQQRADNCPHFEMRKFVSSPLAQITGEDDIDGKQWVQGDSGGKNGQGVKGGKGLLKWVNGGWEPAGIHPFGTGSHTKFVLKRITEHPDKPSTAKLYLAIQFCATAPIIGEQCTPHFLVIPTPFTVTEGGLFLVASRRSLPAEIARLRDGAINASGLNQVYCDPNQLVAAVGQVDSAEGEAPSPTQSAKPDRLAGLSESELQQHRARQYLARIALGETDNGTNIGDRATAESVNGPYGIYQFKYSSRNSLLQRQGIDAWSADPEEQAQAAWAWIQIIGNEEGVDLHQAIAAGDFETADQVLGKGQFTSLPGGAEASRHWSDPGKLEQYGPNGQAPDVGTAPLPTSPGGMPCNPATVAGVPGAIGPEGDGIATGKLSNPVPGYPVTSEYGYRTHPVTGAPSTFHAGIDVGAPPGTPVKAADGGTVDFSGFHPGGHGNLVVVYHGNGLATWYAHNSAINVRVGQKVSAGDKLAEVGSTGTSTGPHLDFGVRTGYIPGQPYSGQHNNPRNFVNF